MNFDVKDEILYLHERRFTPVLQLPEDNKYTDSQKEKVFIADISKREVANHRKENVFTAKVRSLSML
jgi:hypothetical protein